MEPHSTGRLFLQTGSINGELPARIASGKSDHQILAVSSPEEAPPRRHVILVSKDINMRIKAHALGLAAEDYFNDKVLEDTDLLYTGTRELPADFWDRHGKEMESWQQGGQTFYRIRGPLCSRLLVNEFVYLEADRPFYAQVKEVSGKCRRAADAQGHTTSGTSWASPRAIASRTSLEPLMNPQSISHPARRPARGKHAHARCRSPSGAGAETIRKSS